MKTIKRNSIFNKIFSSYFVIIIVLPILIFFFSLNLIRDYSIKILSDALEEKAIIFSPVIIDHIEKSKINTIDTTVKRISENLHSRITIIAIDGNVLGDSEEDLAKMDNHSNRPEVIQALKSGKGQSVRYSNTLKEEMVYVAIPLKNDKQTFGVIRFSFWLKDVSLFMSSLKLKLIQSVFFMVLFVLVVAFIFSKSISKPIKELYNFAIKLPKENFNTRLEIKNDNEISHLGLLLNSMADEIQKLFQRLQEEKDELNAIINNMNDGLLVVNELDKISLANKNIMQSFNDEKLKNKFFWEVIRIDDFRQFVKELRSTNISKQLQIDYAGKYFLINATCLPETKEIIFLFHDISEFKKLEITKRDFISNVSHELRTPLTAIKGFVETLETEKDEPERYLQIIKRNTERLIAIVEDLQILSKLEDKSQRLKKENVNLDNLIRNSLKMFYQKVEEKKLKLQYEIEDEKLGVYGDSFKLEQVLINLVDNAIKYTEKGSVIVRAKKIEKHIVIEIEDTGLGISDKYKERIFERFYVVNKARSRSIGGTGLGLSIVKHILLLHNGTIKLHSKPGEGSKFTVTLPLV